VHSVCQFVNPGNKTEKIAKRLKVKEANDMKERKFKSDYSFFVVVGSLQIYKHHAQILKGKR
jgi:hypothetical protein